MRKIKPMGDRILVEAIEAEVVKGGIIVPTSSQEKPQESRVVELGTGAQREDGSVIPFKVNVDDIIVINKYGGTDVVVDGKEMKIVNATDILGIAYGGTE